MRSDAAQLTRDLNRSGEYRTDFAPETVQAMLEAGKVRSYSRSQFVTRRGQAEPRLCIVMSGRVRLTAFSEDGREMLSIFINPGQCWGVHPCLGGYDETNDALVEDDARILLITPEKVSTLMWEHRDFQNAMIGLLCSRLNLSVRVAEQNGSWSARERLAWRLLHMSGADGTNFESEITLSQESLSSMVHLSRQRTNGLLKAFEKEGSISVGYGKITILDPDLLRREFCRVE